MLPIRRILCPTDFSERSLHAFNVACSLARDYGAHLFVLHVRPSPRGGQEVSDLISDPEEVRQGVLQKLQSLRADDPSIEVERLLKTGDAAREIAHTARETGSDVIVMGTHGHTALARLLLGSVAEAVLREAHCPVFMIKAPFPEDAKHAPGAATGTAGH
jgi:nucleotide-binding universal stress UspA family protein